MEPFVHALDKLDRAKPSGPAHEQDPMAYSLSLTRGSLGTASVRALGRASLVGGASRGLSSARLLEGRHGLKDRTDGRPGLGAVLPNVDLTADFSEEDMQTLRQASHDAGGILVFPNQYKLDTPKQIAFGRKFGTIEPHAVATGTVAECPECLEIIREPSATVVFGENWHSDNSFMEQTCSFSILRGTDVMPKRGSNDTLFSSTEAAFEALSPTMQNLLYGLKAYHSAGKAYGIASGRETNSRAAMEATGKMKFNDDAAILKKDFLHPVVSVHADTGRKSLFVSRRPHRTRSPSARGRPSFKTPLPPISPTDEPPRLLVSLCGSSRLISNYRPHSIARAKCIADLFSSAGLAHLHDAHRGHDAGGWPLQDIVSLQSFLGGVLHPFIAPPLAKATLLQCYCTTVVLYTTPSPDPQFVCHTPYNISNGNIV